MREDNDNKQNVRTKILELVRGEYPETSEENMKKIKEFLFRAVGFLLRKYLHQVKLKYNTY